MRLWSDNAREECGEKAREACKTRGMDICLKRLLSIDVSTFPEYKKWNIKDGNLER